MAWSIPYAVFVVGLVAAPSLVARGMYEVTGDPLWQYLSIDEEGLAASSADIESDGPHVRVRIYWRGRDAMYDTPEDIVETLRNTFDVKGIEAFIAVLPADPAEADGRTTIEFRSGTNEFGPFPVWEAPRYIKPAVQAAHLAFQPTVAEPHRW